MRIFIDCTISFNCTHNTGIQRVVRNIVRESELVGEQLGVECIPVMFLKDSFYYCSPISDQKNSVIPSLYKLLAALNKFLKGLIKLNIFTKRFLPKVVYSMLRITLRPFFIFLYSISQKKYAEDETVNVKMTYKPQQKIILKSGKVCASAKVDKTSVTKPDVLLLLDSNWDNQIWDVVDNFRAKGGFVCSVLYDLIPFSHPETVEEYTHFIYSSWWVNAPLHVDSVMCISKSVRDEYLAWQEEQDLTRKLLSEKVGYFYLGADFYITDLVNQLINSSAPNFLVVGTLEPRKNHDLILDAFEILWKKRYQINLVIVGSYGWKSEKLLDRLERHAENGHRLFLIKNASDRDLNLLYRKSEALIFASLAEGFGLPIVEAFQRGTKVICSDIPVFREIAGNDAVYFDPKNARELANKVSENLSSLKRGMNQKKVVMKEWISWKESTEQLLTRVLAITNNSESSPDLDGDNDLL